MTALLDERELSADERAAIADEARPGVWLYASGNTHRGDGRALDQENTDAAIEIEMRFVFMRQHAERIAISGVLPRFRRPVIMVEQADGSGERAVMNLEMLTQRGGIHSDPLVRLLAYRAWGERDRRWFASDECANLKRRLTLEYFGLMSLGTLDWTQAQHAAASKRLDELRQRIVSLDARAASLT